MEKNIHKLNQHYIVCGIGRVGRHVANELADTKRTYVVVMATPGGRHAIAELLADENSL